MVDNKMNWPPISPENTGFDIDSVFGDLSELLVRVAREVYGIHLRIEQFTDFSLEKCLPFEESFVHEWLSKSLNSQWTSRMRPIAGSVELLSEIGRKNRLHFITARSKEDSIQEWVFRQLPDVPAKNICVMAVGNYDKKAKALKDLGLSYFVEDRIETCELLYRQGIFPIIYHQPWNAGWNGFPRVRDWKEIRILFEKGGVLRVAASPVRVS